jgi:hypothetical protein
MVSIFSSIRSRCLSHSSDWLFSYHLEMTAKNKTMLMAHPIPLLLPALLPPPQGLHPPNSWATLHNPPFALTSKQFLLRHLLSLIRVLIYSSSCLIFCRPLLSCHPPTSVTTLPLPSSLQCPNGSCRKTLMSMLTTTAFSWRHQPLAECSCCICSHVDPDGPHQHCYCYCCCRLCIIIVVVIPVVVVPATPTIADLMAPVEPSCRHFPTSQQAPLCLLSLTLIVA